MQKPPADKLDRNLLECDSWSKTFLAPFLPRNQKNQQGCIPSYVKLAFVRSLPGRLLSSPHFLHFQKLEQKAPHEELGAVAAIRKVQRFGSYRDQTRTLSGQNVGLLELNSGWFLPQKISFRWCFANSWRAMLAALEAKFAPNTAVAAALVKSGDAFLLDTSEALELDTESEDQGLSDNVEV